MLSSLSLSRSLKVPAPEHVAPVRGRVTAFAAFTCSHDPKQQRTLRLRRRAFLSFVPALILPGTASAAATIAGKRTGLSVQEVKVRASERSIFAVQVLID